MNISSEVAEEVIALYQSGVQRKVISRRVNVSQYVIDIILKENGIQKKRYCSAVPDEKLIPLLKSGKSYSEIAEIFGCRRDTIYVHAKRLGMTRELKVAKYKPIDLDSLSPMSCFPKTDTFELKPEDRARLEEVRAAKIRNYERLLEASLLR